ncbi:MAG: hypothetical protein ACK4NW_02025 [Roseinatronobacter sp.]
MSYSDLRITVADYLNRTDLTDTIPAFIDLAEARMQREVRHWRGERRGDAEINSRFTTLPSDYLEMTRLHAVGYPPMQLVTQDWMQRHQPAEGWPQYFCITGGQIEVNPIPSQGVPVEMAYYATLPKIRDNGTNWLFEIAPDAYVYGALLQSAPYLQEDSRITVWASLYQSAVDAINSESARARMPGKMVMR